MRKCYSILALVSLCICFGCSDDSSTAKPNETQSAESGSSVVGVDESTPESRIKSITQTESLIQALSGKKSLLADAFIDRTIDSTVFALPEINVLGLADSNVSNLIEDSVKIANPGIDSVPGYVVKSWGVATTFYWPVAKEKKSKALSEIWTSVPGKFTDAQFGVLKGVFVDENHFNTQTKFEGRLRTSDNRLAGVKAVQTIGWVKKNGDWKIDSWKQKKFELTLGHVELFKDVTDAAFPNPETRRKIALATHEDLIVERCADVDEIEVESNGRKSTAYAIKEVKDDYKGCNDWGSVGQYPSVSAVDYNRDGFDDLFITDRWQAPQLLKNNGDFTFSDVTAESGIDVAEMANCGYFFDFDNDGDSDLFLGMSMVPSLFFENVDGTFQRHEAINRTLADTRFVNAISVADINRDGLLDLYLSTYSTGTGPIEDWIGFVTRESEQLKTKLKILKADRFIDRGGPPNILLMNRGDNFEWTSIDDTLKQYRCSYQSSWMDFDNDGDPDLYICNDFSPDVFLRNDTPRGSYDVSFQDVTEEVIPTMDMGFGMGCNWGDYDNDGDLDLYVSNMYSKAGNRIVDQVEGADPRFKVAAHGNFLFQNNGGVFEQVAGDEKGMQHVARVGWSYGGQFADFDNDGQLDLYVPSGCYSAPKEVKTKIDL